MPTYDITIDSPSTGNTVGSPFTATGTVSSDDGSAFNYTVVCTLTDFLQTERTMPAQPTGPGTWSAQVPGNPGTYTLTAALYVSPNTSQSGNPDAPPDSVSDLTISGGHAPIGIISIDDPPPPPPGPPAPMSQPPTRTITVHGTCDPSSGAARITCAVTAEQDNNKKGSKHHYVVSALSFPASDFDVVMDAPNHKRFAVHAMAFRADGVLLATSTWQHTRK